MSNKINSLSPAFLAAYYRNQCEAVRENIRKALGICFSLDSQVPDNQGVTQCEEKGSYHFTNPIPKELPKTTTFTNNPT